MILMSLGRLWESKADSKGVYYRENTERIVGPWGNTNQAKVTAEPDAMQRLPLEQPLVYFFP